MKSYCIAAGCGLLLLTLCLAAYPQNCTDSSGCLDTTFGSNGFVVASANSFTSGGWGNAVAIQSDGKIVVAADSGNFEDPSTGDFYVLRFYPDGSIDSTFGNGGIVRFAFSATADNETARTIKLQADGKILVAGFIPATDSGGIARLTSDGSLDPSFGTSGKTTFFFAKRERAIPVAMVLHADGRIMVAGTSASSKFGFARFQSNGTLDKTFNGTGTFTVTVASKGNSGGLEDVLIQPDGKYLASGLNGSSKGKPQTWTLMRVNPNGGLDTSFGSAGLAITQFGGTWSVARNLALLPDGRIIAGGDWLANGTSGGQSYVFIRYHPNGDIDTTFGSSGKAIFSSPHFRRMEGMVLQPDGRIVGAGWDRSPDTVDSKVLIMRIEPTGALDFTFGPGGITLANYSDRGDEGIAMAVQSDGKFVLTGTIDSYSPAKIGLYRFLP